MSIYTLLDSIKIQLGRIISIVFSSEKIIQNLCYIMASSMSKIDIIQGNHDQI